MPTTSQILIEKINSLKTNSELGPFLAKFNFKITISEKEEEYTFFIHKNKNNKFWIIWYNKKHDSRVPRLKEEIFEKFEEKINGMKEFAEFGFAADNPEEQSIIYHDWTVYRDNEGLKYAEDIITILNIMKSIGLDLKID